MKTTRNLSLVLVAVFAISTRILPVESWQELFQNLVRFSMSNRPYHPATLRMVSFSSMSELELESLWAISNRIYICNVHLEPENASRTISPVVRRYADKSRRGLYTFVTVVFVKSTAEIEGFNKLIRPTIDQKRDSIIFLTANQEALVQLKQLQGLRTKFIIHSIHHNRGILWVDNIVFSCRTDSMISVKTVENIPYVSPMGANLRGRTLRAASPHSPPYAFRSEVSPLGQADEIDGSLYRLVALAARKFNFTFVADYVGFDYGTYHPENGTWTGSYAKVHYPDSGYDIDLIVSNEIVWNQTDVAPIATKISIIFGVAHPQYRQHWYAFLLPLEPVVWMWAIVTFIFVGLVQGTVMYLIQGRQVKPIVLDSTWILPLAIILEQGLQDIPRGIRYFSLILLFGCTVLGTGYKATLRTHLMIPKPDPVPTTFSELADRADYTVTFADNGEIGREIWKGADDETFMRIKKRLEFKDDAIECYRKSILQHNHACSTWEHLKAASMAELTLNATQDFVLWSKDSMYTAYLSISFQWNSIYVDSFELIVGTPTAMGLVKKWEQDILNDLKQKGRQKMLQEQTTPVFRRLLELSRQVDDVKPMKLGSLIVVFSLVPAGCLLSGLVFCIERKRHSMKIA